MNGQVYRVSSNYATEHIGLEAETWATNSSLLLAGIYDDKCICICGLIPTSLISDKAYIWFWAPTVIPKIVLGRGAKRVLNKLLELYPKLICNCYNADSVRWLLSLGAKQTGPNLYAFVRK